jgi:hypothetical protein
MNPAETYRYEHYDPRGTHGSCGPYQTCAHWWWLV